MRVLGDLPVVRAAARSAFVGAVVLGGVLGTAAVASAHDPIILTDQQTTPQDGPLLVDGTVSFAVYGRLGGAGDERGLRVQLVDGDTLQLGLLVPAVEPEASFAAGQFPVLEVTQPDGATRTLTAGTPRRFDEPFSSTSYLDLASLSEPAQAGVYSLTVHAPVPTRFVVSVGSEERFGSAVENVADRDAGVAGVQQWYRLAPGAASSPDTTAAPGPDTTGVGDTTAPVVVAAPSAADTTAPDATLAAVGTTDTVTLGGPSSTTADDEETDGTAGTLVFIGVMAAIVVGGLVLYARRRSRGIGTPPT